MCLSLLVSVAVACPAAVVIMILMMLEVYVEVEVAAGVVVSDTRNHHPCCSSSGFRLQQPSMILLDSKSGLRDSYPQHLKQL